VRRFTVITAQQTGVLAASLLSASLLIFLALHYLPGDAAAILAGSDATDQQVALLERQLGLDRAVPLQYFDWMTGAVRGDLGTSLIDGRSVSTQILEKLQVTLPLCIAALVLSTLIAVPLGMIAGARHRTWYGQALSPHSSWGSS
jgi:peptide/nickel transport system permease protein